MDAPPRLPAPQLPSVPPGSHRSHRPALLLLAAIAVFLAGCVGFTQPVAMGVPVDVSPYVGTWVMDDGSGNTLELTRLGAPGTLAGTMSNREVRGDLPPVQFTVQLTKVGGQTVASIGSNDEGYSMGYGRPLWLLASVGLLDDGRIVLRGLDQAAVVAAVESGDLEGERLSRDGDAAALPPAFDTHVDALSAYLNGHPEVFASEEKVVLVRGVQDQERGPSVAYPYPGYGQTVPWPMPGQHDDRAAFPTATPVGAVGRVLGDGDRPYALDGLLVGLLAILIVGVVAAAAIRYVRRQPLAAPSAAVVPDEGDDEWLAEDGGTPSGSAATLRRYAWPGLLILAVALGPALYVTTLLHGLAFPGGGLGIGPGTQALMYGFAPYLLVFSLGALIGAAEVISTYPTFSVEALSTRWAVVLVLLNALATALVFSTATAVSTGMAHPLLRALAVAVGFAILMRTRFVLARDLRGPAAGDGVSFDFGWLYARFQELCHQRIERDLLRHPRYAVDRLLTLWPDDAALDHLAADAIATREPKRSAELRAELDTLRGENLGPGIRRARTAWFIARTGGPAHVGFLIEHADPPAGSISSPVSD